MSEYRNQLDALNAEIDFPVTKQRLIDLAVARGFDDDEVRLALESTPIEIFNSPRCVTRHCRNFLSPAHDRMPSATARAIIPRAEGTDVHDDHHSDEEVSVNYPELLEAVQERADLDEHGADSATIATLQALSERIGAKETRHLLAELPKQVRERILPPNRVEDPSLNAFVERVGRLENVSAGQARAHAGTVLGVLREAVSAGEARDVFARLSNEYADLLR